MDYLTFSIIFGLVYYQWSPLVLLNLTDDSHNHH